MADYVCTIIKSPFSSSGEFPGNREDFSRSLADWIVEGGEIGMWKFTESNDRIATSTTVVGFYSKTSYSKVRRGESIIGFWTITESWATRCCDCGCFSCDEECQCCCKTCEKCTECACCCGC